MTHADHPCGCDLFTGRCTKHQRMMTRIHATWNAQLTPASVMHAIWRDSNGYGSPGFVPPQGWDWSGIRDSTPDAVERMYRHVRKTA